MKISRPIMIFFKQTILKLFLNIKHLFEISEIVVALASIS